MWLLWLFEFYRVAYYIVMTFFDQWQYLVFCDDSFAYHYTESVNY